jgi:hypothetical protein
MPIVMVAPDDGGKNYVPRYRTNYHPDFTQTGIDAIRALRKATAADREFFAGVRSQCGRMDPAGARWASDEVKAATRLEKACTLALRWIDGDAGATYPRHWPTELVDELDRVLGVAYLADGQHQDLPLAIRAMRSPAGRA